MDGAGSRPAMKARPLPDLLQDVLDYGQEAIETVADLSADQILGERMREHAVLRTVQIVGEAASQATKLDATLLSRIPDLRRAIGLRNVLVHGYVKVRMEEIVLIVRHDLPDLLTQVRAALGEHNS